MKAVLLCGLVVLSAFQMGCSDTETPIQAANSETESGGSASVSQKAEVSQDTAIDTENMGNVVAQYGDQSISLEDVDDAIQIALFDLEWRKYQLRKQTLARMLQTLSATESREASVTVLLEPPIPPRIELPNDKRPTIGSPKAPITLSVFCSYQSTHCGRLHPILGELKEGYETLLNIRFYDYPQRFHRHGFRAANAVHCAMEQGEMTGYQSAIYMDQQTLGEERLLLIAEQLRMDMAQFQECADSGRYAANIEADLSLGKALGLGNVPIVFINGLYAKGPQSTEAYRYYIDQELARMNISSPVQVAQEPVESKLPFELIATTVSSDETRSVAQIALQKDGDAANFRKGDFLIEDVEVIHIEERKIHIRNGQQLEFILLTGSQHDRRDEHTEHDGQPETESLLEIANVHYETVPGAPGRDEDARPYRELPSTGEMMLDRQWIDGQLLNQSELERKFHLADHSVQGVHLVKLQEIQDDRFYNTLGLRNGDVLMRVNEKWVHEEQNPLWGELAKGGLITVHLMRKGFPVRYDYRIDE